MAFDVVTYALLKKSTSNEIKEGLANEITRATNAENELDVKIEDETTRAKAKDVTVK